MAAHSFWLECFWLQLGSFYTVYLLFYLSSDPFLASTTALAPKPNLVRRSRSPSSCSSFSLPIRMTLTETTSSPTPASMSATVHYVDPSIVDTVHVGRDTSGRDQGELPLQSYSVELQNARQRSVTFHRHGAQLIASPLHVDWKAEDPRQLVQHYYPHCEALVRQVLEEIEPPTGQPKRTKIALVRAFDHNIRQTATYHPSAETDQDTTDNNNNNNNAAQIQAPLPMVHGDYTAVSAPRRLQQLAEPVVRANDIMSTISKDPQPLLPPSLVQEVVQGKRRFLFLNVWRNWNPTTPVQAWPLCCVDATSVSADRDYRTLQIHYTDRVGENYLAAHAKDHQWLHWPDMVHDEALLIKQWDSRGTGDQGDDNNSENPCTLCLHSAADLHVNDNEPKVPKERKSIEVRCVVIYEE